MNTPLPHPGIYIDKTPPHSPDAERAVLGSMLLNGDCVPEVRAIIDDPAEFYIEANRTIFGAIKALADDGVRVDEVLVCARLLDTGNLESVGGTDYVGALLIAVPSEVNAAHYAREVASKAVLRRAAVDAATTLHRIYGEGATAAEIAPDSFRSLRQGGERKAFRAVPITELGPSEPVDWVWPGYIARGSITLFTGLWKAGKTTMLSHLLRDIYRGGGLVEHAIDTPTLLLTEEGDSQWRERRDRLGLSENIRLLKREGHTRPSKAEWCLQVAEIVRLVESMGAGLVVIDTIPSFWPVLNENDAGEMLDALTPLRAIKESGAALLIVMHPRKGGGDQATGTRGSGALPGFVDTIVELGRYDTASMTDNRRKLTAYGRYEETPAEAVFELTDNGYVSVGVPAFVRNADFDGTIRAVLTSGPHMTFEEVREAWPTKPPPGATGLRAALNKGAERGEWYRSGTGRRGDPFRYGLAPADSFHSPHSLSERNESTSPEVAEVGGLGWEDSDRLDAPPVPFGVEVPVADS